MRHFQALVLCLGVVSSVAADEVPGVDQVIAEAAKNPVFSDATPSPAVLQVAVSASELAAQDHVLKGIAHLHGGWDFEAYRHFSAALAIDPECLMAHWGVAMALIDPAPDLRDERDAALRRMLHLVEEGKGTDLEQAYAWALTVFFNEGPAQAADAFRKVSEKYPNDVQLKMISAAFGRTGYAEDGSVTPDQERVEKSLKALVDAMPEHPLVLNAYLTVRAEAPDLRGDVELARKLCQLAPDYAPFRHLLGHYEWRSGGHARAVDAFGRAGELYAAWMKELKLEPIDCPGWIKAECFRAVALATMGDYPTALAAAKAVAAIDVPSDETMGDGARLLLWEGRTLPVRILMRRSGPGDTAAAIAALPPKESQKLYGDLSLATWYYQGLAFILEARKALEAGDVAGARQISQALTLHGERFAETRGRAQAAGETSFRLRAFQALEVGAAELLGQIAMKSKGTIAPAFNWFRAGVDRQTRPSMLMPPVVLLPMETRLAEYHLAAKEAQQAVDILVRAQKSYPKDIEVMSRLEKALRAAGHPDHADEIAAEIKALGKE